MVSSAISMFVLTAQGAAPAKRNSRPPSIDFVKDIKPLLNHYCDSCHGEKKKGGLSFRTYIDEQTAVRDRKVFEKVLAKLEAHEMPPENKPQPSPAECQMLTNWVTATFFACDCNHPDPGRVTIRRLNRVEYNNTIRELTGVEFQPADDFPSDDTGYGFDNIGDVLSLSPVLMEKYLAAAEKIMNAVFEGARINNQVAQGTKTRGYEKIMRDAPASLKRSDRARKIITAFAGRAFRRPATSDEQERFLTLFKSLDQSREGFDQAIKLTLEAVLISPQFLFRGEVQTDPNNEKAIGPVDDYALASRLSYFLWSSMPDEELFAQAARHTLRRNLGPQVMRMLKNPKAHALAENFAGQWLQLRNLKLMSPDSKQFPSFNEKLRRAMEKETEMFFESVWREDRSVLDFIDADYTFVNERLAKLYGIEGIEGEEFQRVALKGKDRGGLLTQASILTITSNPTRTSAVKRGKWVLENIIGAPPPPPPPNVPELKEGKEALTGTLRQRMEKHRADPNCASCHARMDPIGFGFENFDGIGAWREKEGEFAIDASGKLISGETFDGPAGLKKLLLNEKRNEFIRCLTDRMLTYALGRGLEYYDKCAVGEITRNLAKHDHKFSALVLEIARSTPFQMRRGEKAPTSMVAQNETAR